MAELPQYNIANEFVNITIPEKLRTALRGKPPSGSDSMGRQMHKVPALLCLENDNQKDYDPLVVSFGPYHQRKPELQQAEDFKPKALQLFVADTGKDVLFYCTRVLELINDARNCYIEDFRHKFDDPEFAASRCLFHYLLHLISPNSDMHYEITSLHLGDFVSAMVPRDLCLLENQIPFWVLKLVIRKGYGQDQGEEFLNDFLNETVFGEYKRTGIASSEEQPLSSS